MVHSVRSFGDKNVKCAPTVWVWLMKSQQGTKTVLTRLGCSDNDSFVLIMNPERLSKAEFKGNGLVCLAKTI